MKAVLRRRWLRVHRWLALSVGWLLAAVALMGALLVVARPLDQHLHPELFLARSGSGPAAAAVALEPLRQRLLGEFGPHTALGFRLPRQPGQTLAVTVRAGWRGTVYLDPHTGLEQGRRSDADGVLNTLFKLHSSLGLDDTGKAILATIALAYLAMLATGAVLWWPRRWGAALSVELRKGTLRSLFDLHRSGGAVLGLLIAVSVTSGAYMAWRPLNGVVSWLAGATPVQPPKLPKVVALPTLPTLPILPESPGLASLPHPPESAGSAPGNPAAVPLADLDTLLAQARRALPGMMLTLANLPAKADRPVRVRFLAADDPHPNGLSSVWLDPRSGAVLAVNRWDSLDPGARVVAIVYPLHTGELGGPLLEAMVALNGLGLAGLGVSGLWLWWRRRRQARAA